AGFNSKENGVLTLFHRSINFKTENIIMDPMGRYVIRDLEHVTLVNIYGPNKDEPTFFTHLISLLLPFMQSNIIIGGDFGIILSPDLDKSNNLSLRLTRSHAALSELMSSLGLFDPNTRDYTFTSTTHKTHSRLDLFLISHNILKHKGSTSLKMYIKGPYCKSHL
uniref:Endonuclease/exonuclease/phosphatase domain-containing protein n=1 Tax=Latimeria chalumnae TaxID=7897 RepID=H3AE03_LATCH